LFPALPVKKATCAFERGAITSDGGVLLLAQAERRLGIVDRLAALIVDGRDPARVTHSLSDILLARVLAITAGYQDVDDLDALRHDPAFMMALGKAPGEEIGLASQPTMSRWENARVSFLGLLRELDIRRDRRGRCFVPPCGPPRSASRMNPKEALQARGSSRPQHPGSCKCCKPACSTIVRFRFRLHSGRRDKPHAEYRQNFFVISAGYQTGTKLAQSTASENIAPERTNFGDG
jgi:hypothetical protein